MYDAGRNLRMVTYADAAAVDMIVILHSKASDHLPNHDLLATPKSITYMLEIAEATSQPQIFGLHVIQRRSHLYYHLLAHY
jgi:hypothetical protein